VNLDFFVTAVKDGKIAATEGSKIDAVVSAEQFAQIEKQGILSPVELTLGPGKYDLILAVRDNPTGLIGTLNVPVELAAPAP
jgi:hypothetical protein